jgi:hypothetical protein
VIALDALDPAAGKCHGAVPLGGGGILGAEDQGDGLQFVSRRSGLWARDLRVCDGLAPEHKGDDADGTESDGDGSGRHAAMLSREIRCLEGVKKLAGESPAVGKFRDRLHNFALRGNRFLLTESCYDEIK